MKTTRNRNSIYAPSGTLAVDTAGTAYRYQPIDGQVDEAELDIRFVIRHTQTGGATSPTSQLIIQDSSDNVNWKTAIAGTSRTADGTYIETLDSTSVALGPYVRAFLDVGGGTPPNVTNITVDMVSNAPLTLIAA